MKRFNRLIIVKITKVYNKISITLFGGVSCAPSETKW